MRCNENHTGLCYMTLLVFVIKTLNIIENQNRFEEITADN